MVVVAGDQDGRTVSGYVLQALDVQVERATHEQACRLAPAPRADARGVRLSHSSEHHSRGGARRKHTSCRQAAHGQRRAAEAARERQPDGRPDATRGAEHHRKRHIQAIDDYRETGGMAGTLAPHDQRPRPMNTAPVAVQPRKFWIGMPK